MAFISSHCLSSRSHSFLSFSLSVSSLLTREPSIWFFCCISGQTYTLHTVDPTKKRMTRNAIPTATQYAHFSNREMVIIYPTLATSSRAENNVSVIGTQFALFSVHTCCEKCLTFVPFNELNKHLQPTSAYL